MNELVYFSLILLIFIRIIGLGTALNFYYDWQERLYLYFILGWILAIVGNIFPFLLDVIESDFLMQFLLILNALLVSLGMYSLLFGFFSYFLELNSMYFVTSSIIIMTIGVLLFIILGTNISVSFSVITINSTIIIAFTLPIFRLTKFRNAIGKSVRWYYLMTGFVIGYLPISFFIFIQGAGYGLYYSEDTIIIILNYMIAIGTNLLFIVLIIHLEYNISNERRNQLKDKYSHNLGNILQTIYSSVDAFKAVSKLENEEQSNLDLITQKCEEASELIKEIRKI